MPLDQALQMAREAGYRGWEVAPFMLADDISQLTTTDRQAYRSQVEHSGLSIIGLHWLLAKTEGFHLTTLDEAIRKRTSEYLGKLA
ncbi:MAG: sugar phosphate isomerase/epimerase, partial [Planctomycetota bacterium]